MPAEYCRGGSWTRPFSRLSSVFFPLLGDDRSGSGIPGFSDVGFDVAFNGERPAATLLNREGGSGYRMATGFTGDPVPPTTRSGFTVSMNS